MAQPLDQVELHSLEVRCIVGILASERIEPQRLVFDIAVGLSLEECGDTGDLTKSVNYAAIESWMTALACQGRFWLIESMALAAVRGLLLAPGRGEERAQLQTASVCIRKPTILGGRAVPAVRIARTAPVNLPCVEKDGARCTVLVRTDKDGAWRVELESGATWVAGPDIGGCVMAGEVESGSNSINSGESLPCGFGACTAVGGPAVLWLVGTPVTNGASGAYAG